MNMWVALIIQHAMPIRQTAICGLSHYTTFSHIISFMARFSKKKVTQHKMRVLIFSMTFI